MKIQDIYTFYKIPPFLQTHMYRVAAVGKMICDASKRGVDEDVVLTACLTHDLGNILKMDFDVFPDTWEPEGIPYWSGVKEGLREKYGDDEHTATSLMAKEIGVSQEIQDIVDACGFSKMTDAFESKNVPLMMLGYCDMRVMPHGIHSLQKRIDDLYVRYQTKISALPRKKKDFEVNRQATFAIEEYLFSGLPIKPEDINDESTKETVEKLKDYEM